MNIEHSFIVSDIHLGSRFCRHADFMRFLDRLPAGAALVLNGDVVDRWHVRLKDDDLAVLDRLRVESERRPVIWVRGNHDRQFTLDDPRRIEFRDSYALERRLYVAHGHEFDFIMPKNQFFLRLFRLFHRLRVLLGADSVHVAHYAKRYRALYRLLLNHVSDRALGFARANGYAAIACGHTHAVEDRTVRGIRYLNTGSWTEPPLTCIVVTPLKISVSAVEGLPT